MVVFWCWVESSCCVGALRCVACMRWVPALHGCVASSRCYVRWVLALHGCVASLRVVACCVRGEGVHTESMKESFQSI